jgi:membrane associated rhomboid family serine protease/Zn-finger nucleic acid-binding protein
VFTCPNCRQALERARTDLGVLWLCETCHGRAVGFELLRRSVAPKFMNGLWRMAFDAPNATGKTCPACEREMTQVSPEGVTGLVTLDLCTRCHFLWFDARETESLPILPPKPESAPLPQEARELIAIHRVEMMAKEARGSGFEASGPESFWETVATVAGFPVEDEPRTLQRLPLMTWLLGAAIAGIGLCSWPRLPALVAAYGLIPVEAGRWYGLTFLTSFFLHGSILHLVGNLYFLLFFGDDVEDYLGKFRFALLVFLATIAGDFLHVLLAPHSTLPCIGASGGISGLLAFYALRFPQAKLTFFYGTVGWSRWMRFPAWGVFIFWFVLQGFGLWRQAAGLSHVSSAAHLGGAFAGVLAWLLDRQARAPIGVAAG